MELNLSELSISFTKSSKFFIAHLLLLYSANTTKPVYKL